MSRGPRARRSLFQFTLKPAHDRGDRPPKTRWRPQRLAPTGRPPPTCCRAPGAHVDPYAPPGTLAQWGRVSRDPHTHPVTRATAYVDATTLVAVLHDGPPGEHAGQELAGVRDDAGSARRVANLASIVWRGLSAGAGLQHEMTRVMFARVSIKDQRDEDGAPRPGFMTFFCFCVDAIFRLRRKRRGSLRY